MKDGDPEPKPIAVLSAAVADYERLLASDEVATLEQLKAYGEEMRALVEEHGGSIELTREEALALFEGPLDAARCALEIQRRIDLHSETLPLERVMCFRIGLHVGPEVEVAVHLRGLASPGGICLSGAVHDEVKSQLAARFVDLGEREVENVSGLVPAWRLQRSEPVAPGRARRPPPASGWAPGWPVLAAVAALTAGGLIWSLLPESASAPEVVLEGLTTAELSHWLLVGDDKGALDRALAQAEGAVAAAPQDAQALAALAVVRLFRGDHAEARVAAERAHAAREDDRLIQAVLAQTLIYSGQVRAGLRLAQTLAQDDPASLLAQVCLGNGYRMMGRRADAIAAYERAVALAPGHVPALANLAVLYHEAGQSARSQAAARELRERHPEFRGAAFAERIPFSDPLDRERLSQGLARAGLD